MGLCDSVGFSKKGSMGTCGGGRVSLWSAGMGVGDCIGFIGFKGFCGWSQLEVMDLQGQWG